MEVERSPQAPRQAGDGHVARRRVVGADAVRRQGAVIDDAARVRDVLLRVVAADGGIGEGVVHGDDREDGDDRTGHERREPRAHRPAAGGRLRLRALDGHRASLESRTVGDGVACPESAPVAACSLFRMRILVTGGGGFLGSHLVERLESDGHDVVVARQRRLRPDDDGRHAADVRRRRRRTRLPPRRRGRGHRREPGESGALLVREPRPWARTSSSRRASTRRRSSSSSGPSAPIRSSRRSPSPRATSGTVTRRRRTLRTAWRRKRSSSAPRATASSTASTRSSCSRPTCTGRATTSTSKRRT